MARVSCRADEFDRIDRLFDAAADRLVGTAERLNLVDSKTADALMNRFGADASEHLALGTARRGGAKPVLDALADRPAAEIEDAAASAAITPELRRLLRGLVERNRAAAPRETERIARVEATLDKGSPLDRDDPADRAAAA